MTLLEGLDGLNTLPVEKQKVIHRKYFDDLKSLNKTAQWAKQKYNFKKLTRHHLSAFFHNKGWDVHPPNGRSVMPHRRDDFYDGDSRFAHAMIETAYEDIVAFMGQDGGNLLDFISACWFFTGDLYQNCLDTLDRNNESNFSPDKDSDITGNLNTEKFKHSISKDIIIKGASIYEDIYSYWLRK